MPNNSGAVLIGLLRRIIGVARCRRKRSGADRNAASARRFYCNAKSVSVRYDMEGHRSATSVQHYRVTGEPSAAVSPAASP